MACSNLLLAFIPDIAPTLDYTHIPLQEQFDTQGIRQIELDIFDDPEGGLYANRPALALLGEDPASGIPELDEPGLKVLHVQEIDFETTCYTFVSLSHRNQRLVRRQSRPPAHHGAGRSQG